MAWNRPTEGRGTREEGRGGQRNVHLKGLVAGAFVVLGTCIAAWIILSGSDDTPARGTKRKARGTINEVTPAAAPKAETNAVAAVEEETDPSKRIVEVMSCVTNASLGKICRVYRTADGKTHKQYIPSYEPMFRHQTDTLISMLLSGRKTGIVPPMPMLNVKIDLDKEFRESLKDPIVIEEGDSEKRAEVKKQVIAAREEIRQMMDEGLTFREVMSETRRLFSENAEIRRKAMSELRKIHAEGDVEGERKYQITIDAALQQMGIDPLDRPLTADERREEIRARRAEKDAKAFEQPNKETVR